MPRRSKTAPPVRRPKPQATAKPTPAPQDPPAVEHFEAEPPPADDFNPDIAVTLDSPATEVEQVTLSISTDNGETINLPATAHIPTLPTPQPIADMSSPDHDVDMAAAAFVNRLKLLTFMDMDDLEGVGLNVMGGGVWPAFRDNPFRWLIEANREDAKAVYELLIAVEAYQKEPGHG